MKKIIGSLLLVAFALVGCSTTQVHKSDGKLCTGTKRSYQVKGSWYHPQEHYDYEETGTASWYGDRFHGSPKSCGEIFNMHGISAAHKTLPIPSVVRVTNVNTGKNVKLLVDDRGPFVDNRIIDLSKGAAVHLGIHQRGLGTVCVECLPEESKAFAKFVSKYGRYGRDPSGRSWETIFREHFDYEGCAPVPKPLKSIQPRRVQSKRPMQQREQNMERPRKAQPFQKPRGKVIPISTRYSEDEDVDQGEIKELLDKTRSYMERRVE
jgi:rare lipoprotein A (peptidoglycan hydrolase)